MKKIIMLTFLFITFHTATAKPYGTYNPLNIINKNNHQLNQKYYNEILNDLIAHAGQYPTDFKNNANKQRALGDVRVLINIFNMFLKNKKKNSSFFALYNSAQLHQIAYNLNDFNNPKIVDSFYIGAIKTKEFQTFSTNKKGQVFTKFSSFALNSEQSKMGLNMLQATYDNLKYKPASCVLAQAYITQKNFKEAKKYAQICNKFTPSEKNTFLLKAVSTCLEKTNCNSNTQFVEKVK